MKIQPGPGQIQTILDIALKNFSTISFLMTILFNTFLEQCVL